MPYIIDGNNLIGSSTDIALEDPGARKKILEIVRKYQQSKKRSVIIVFDGEPDGVLHKQPLNEKLTVVYPRYGDSADDEIKRILNRYTYFKDVVLVTSDRELKSYARKKGARIINSTQFHYELKRYYRVQGIKESNQQRINARLSDSEIDQWLKIFED
ncbi:MAG: NYN domain-containing protein [Candidatus Aminicenantes bacterium]|nr:NYN domain-containing protein [Candidatus Aminicenantes bacterium]